eukprot:2128070-Rhodomonas_salina.1
MSACSARRRAAGTSASRISLCSCYALPGTDMAYACSSSRRSRASLSSRPPSTSLPTRSSRTR